MKERAEDVFVIVDGAKLKRQSREVDICEDARAEHSASTEQSGLHSLPIKQCKKSLTYGRDWLLKVDGGQVIGQRSRSMRRTPLISLPFGGERNKFLFERINRRSSII